MFKPTKSKLLVFLILCGLAVLVYLAGSPLLSFLDSLNPIIPFLFLSLYSLLLPFILFGFLLAVKFGFIQGLFFLMYITSGGELLISFFFLLNLFYLYFLACVCVRFGPSLANDER